MSSESSDQHVLRSWHANAGAWTDAVRARRIESRRLVTDAAIVDAVLARKPDRVLDVGCGEGWLVRALAAHGIVCTGVDAVADLVAQARAAGGGSFEHVDYQALAGDPRFADYDVAVCNFALIGHAPVEALIGAMPGLLAAGGALVVQTLHPLAACGDAPYRDGWREGSWQGFDDRFTDPAPWYFRTLESWVALLDRSGLRLAALREPLHPATGKPASLILVGTR